MGNSHFNSLFWCLTHVKMSTWEMLMLLSDALAATNLPPMRAPEDNTSDKPCAFLPLYSTQSDPCYE